MIGRRTVLLACAATVARASFAADLPVPASDSLAFRLLRHDVDIGRHTVTFDRQGDTLTVHVAVKALVKVLSIPFVHYEHNATEVWQGNTLVSLSGQTDRNGSREWMSATRTPAGLQVQGNHTKTYIAPEPVGSTTYWDKQMLDLPLISMGDGRLLRPKVAERQAESIPLASGAKIEAQHYNLSGPFNVDLWYDTSNTWAGMAVTVVDGSVVHYERL